MLISLEETLNIYPHFLKAGGNHSSLKSKSHLSDPVLEYSSFSTMRIAAYHSLYYIAPRQILTNRDRRASGLGKYICHNSSLLLCRDINYQSFISPPPPPPPPQPPTPTPPHPQRTTKIIQSFDALRQTDGSMLTRRNASALAMEIRLFCIKLSIWGTEGVLPTSPCCPQHLLDFRHPLTFEKPTAATEAARLFHI